MIDDRIEWVNYNLRLAERPQIPAHLHDAVRVLSAVRPPHNWWPPTSLWADALDFDHWGLSFLFRHEFATFDGSELTQLVLAAHAYGARVSISPWVAYQDPERAARVLASQRADARDAGYRVRWAADDPRVSAGILEVRVWPRFHEMGRSHPRLDNLVRMTQRWSERLQREARRRG